MRVQLKDFFKKSLYVCSIEANSCFYGTFFKKTILGSNNDQGQSYLLQSFQNKNVLTQLLTTWGNICRKRVENLFRQRGENIFRQRGGNIFRQTERGKYILHRQRGEHIFKQTHTRARVFSGIANDVTKHSFTHPSRIEHW